MPVWHKFKFRLFLFCFLTVYRTQSYVLLLPNRSPFGTFFLHLLSPSWGRFKSEFSLAGLNWVWVGPTSWHACLWGSLKWMEEEEEEEEEFIFNMMGGVGECGTSTLWSWSLSGQSLADVSHSHCILWGCWLMHNPTAEHVCFMCRTDSYCVVVCAKNSLIFNQTVTKRMGRAELKCCIGLVLKSNQTYSLRIIRPMDSWIRSHLPLIISQFTTNPCSLCDWEFEFDKMGPQIFTVFK